MGSGINGVGRWFRDKGMKDDSVIAQIDIARPIDRVLVGKFSKTYLTFLAGIVIVSPVFLLYGAIVDYGKRPVSLVSYLPAAVIVSLASWLAYCVSFRKQRIAITRTGVYRTRSVFAGYGLIGNWKDLESFCFDGDPRRKVITLVKTDKEEVYLCFASQEQREQCRSVLRNFLKETEGGG
jgi:hypothetical protein